MNDELLELHDELRRIAAEQGISFEEALVRLRDLVFLEPEPIEPPEHKEHYRG